MNKMTINDIPKVSKTPFENIEFVEPTYTSASRSRVVRLKDYIFKNCKFKEFSMNSFLLEVINCVFENCVFDSRAVIADLIHCTFRNCTFPDSFKSAFGSWTTFFECNYDDSFLESLHKEMACPLTGEFVGWKKACLCKRRNDSVATKMYPVIVKLLIPSESKRSSALSNKCRCEKARVLEVQTEDGCKIDIPEDCFVASIFEYRNAQLRMQDYLDTPRYVKGAEQPSMMRFLKTRYVPGEMVYADSFDTEPLITCGNGIHFFMTRKEACEYDFN